MAFKMKGSPAKMGTIKGTSGYASALKNASALKQVVEEKDDPIIHLNDGYEEDRPDFVSKSNTYTLGGDYGVEGVPKGAVIKDPKGLVGKQYDERTPDAAYTYTVKGNVVTITGVSTLSEDDPGYGDEKVLYGQELAPVESKRPL